MSATVLFIAVALASAVEMVEALTIILAAGITRGYRSALAGTAVALVLLAALVGVFGPTLLHLVPISTLRTVIGALLLVFGMQWLRKAILRASGRKAMHDEGEIYEREVKELSTIARSGKSIDPTGFVVAFKGTFLEGLEVVIIVISLGSSDHRLGLAGIAAGAAALVVAAAGVVLSKALTSVPENKMKMAVGIMLTSFGTFWSGEGLGVVWPGKDAFLVVLVALFAVVAAAFVRASRRTTPVSQGTPSPDNALPSHPGGDQK